jgi:hypothetical protein
VKLIARCVAVLITFMALLVVPLAAPASAAVVFNERFDLAIFSFNTCNGEFVELTGFVHVVVKEKKGGTVTVHANAHGQGVGDRGNEYVLNLQEKDSFSTNEAHFRYREVLISKGSAPNQHVLLTVDFPPGNVNFDVDCRG